MKPIELQLFRMVDGQRRAVTLLLSPDRVILEERMGTAPVLLGSAPLEYERNLIHRGVGHHKDELGRTVIDSIPEREQEIMKFFSKTPCWFPGCDVLRAEYEKEYETIGGVNCQACDHGTLIRKYMPRIDALLPRTDGVAPMIPIAENVTML